MSAVWLAVGLALLGGDLWASRAGTNLTAWVPIFKGVDHAVGTNTPGGGGFAELQVVHIVRVDLADPDVRLFTSPRLSNYVAGARETAGYTVSDFLRTNRLQVAINAGLFDPTTYYLAAGTPMDINGLSICQGEVVSAQTSAANSAAILFTSNNVPTVLHTNWPAASTAGIYTAVSGTYPLVIRGVNVGYRYQNDPDSLHRLNPRTAYGVSQDRRYLYCLTIDGRQPGYSVGAYDYQTAAWLLLAGAYDGVNMDGGGSSTLVMQDSTGKPVNLNRSSAVADSGRQRTVGSHFGLFAKPLPGFINEVVAMPDDTVASVTWTTIEPATSQVAYGTSPALGLTTPLGSTLATNHAVLLAGLTPATAYYFQVLATAAGAEHRSSNLVFVTTNYVVAGDVFDLTHAWRYTTANLDGVAWTAPALDDAGWEGPGPGLLWVDVRATGPLPEVQPKATPMPADPANNGFPFLTYYLRTHFDFPHSPLGVALVFSNYLDDGAVFYLNGREIYRLRMDPAPDPILHDTLAVGYACGGDATCPDLFTVGGDVIATNLVTGDNVLAAEVHNYNPRSPDITFGVSLGYTAPRAVPPELTIGLDGGTLTLRWARGGFILQEADDPAGPWTEVPGPVLTSPHTVPLAGATRYFRLRKL